MRDLMFRINERFRSAVLMTLFVLLCLLLVICILVLIDICIAACVFWKYVLAFGVLLAAVAYLNHVADSHS